jgi:hypothetical protein
LRSPPYLIKTSVLNGSLQECLLHSCHHYRLLALLLLEQVLEQPLVQVLPLFQWPVVLALALVLLQECQTF